MSGKLGSRTTSPGFVDLAEGEQRNRGAVLDHRLDRRPVRRRGLVVDVDLAALQGEVDRAAALEPEGRVDVGVEQVEGQQGREVQAGRAMPPKISGVSRSIRSSGR